MNDVVRPVIFRYLEGMWGTITDPGAREFTNKVKLLDPERIDIGESPYPDYKITQIAADFNAAPANAILIGGGTSLGCNNIAMIGLYCPHRIIHGIWGFQASDYGARAKAGTTYDGIPANTLFAHEVYNPVWLQTGGLGAYEWVRSPSNHTTNLYVSKRYDFHPGETEQVQAMFLAEIGRVIAKPGA